MFVQHLPHNKCSAGSGDSLMCGLGLGPEEEGDVQSALCIRGFNQQCIPGFNQLWMENIWEKKKSWLLLTCTV